MEEVKKVYSIPEIKDIIAPIAKSYGIEKIWLFGSYARGEATINSDVDLMIDDGGNIKTLFELGGFYNNLTESLGKSVDVIDYDAVSEKFYERIKDEEVIIYDR